MSKGLERRIEDLERRTGDGHQVPARPLAWGPGGCVGFCEERLGLREGALRQEAQRRHTSPAEVLGITAGDLLAVLEGRRAK